ncbi:MAG: FHA domain-containing protein [Thermoanaerobaculia bacterium]
MSEVECPSCGSDLPAPSEADGDQLAVACPHCGAELRVSIASTPADLEVESVFQPQPPSKTLADDPAVPAAIEERQDPLARGGAGTVLLDAEDVPQETPGLDLKVQAYLDQVGAMPGEGRFTLERATTVVGREGADITIDDPAVSSRHFEVEATGGEFFIRDLDSSNGTTLNGDKIRTAQLSPGDKIRAGRTTFVFGTLNVIPWDGP